jgi:RND family efflux transporter MFP subunit
MSEPFASGTVRRRGALSRAPASVLALAAALLIVAGLTAALHAHLGNAEEAAGRPPLPVTVTTFRGLAGYEREQRFLGVVQAATRSQVGFELPGTIAEILVREGDAVSAGTLLARLDTRSLQARRHAAAATVERVAAERELAAARSERQAPLATSGAISAQAYDDSRLAEKALTSALAAARAELRALDIDIEKSSLRAPYAARVGRQLRDTGAVTQPGAPVFSLVASSAREAHIGVAVEQAQHLETGAKYAVTWRDTSVEATLRAVRPDVDPVSMTTVAIFDLPPDVDAFDGEPVAVSLPRRVTSDGGWLPLSALLEGERGIWTVLRVHDGSTAREAVEVLHVSGDRAFVRGTLRDGDRVIADGVHRIAPGTRVTPLES